MEEKNVDGVGDDKKEVTPPLEEKKEIKLEVKTEVKPPVSPEESPEAKAKAEHLANLNKAVEAETERLRKIREDQKRAKLGLPPEEDELPVIDKKDPSSKAWMKEIAEASRPAQQELEKAKDERRAYTLRQFLSDKPSLAKNPEKIKAMMETYDRLKTSTELTNEGIMMDLEKAYAAEFHDELISAARQSRVEGAMNDALFSDIAVSRGSTTHSNSKTSTPKVYSEDEKAVLAKWGMTPAEHAKMVDDMNKV